MTTKDDDQDPTTYVELRPTKNFHEAIDRRDLVYFGSVLLLIALTGFQHGIVAAIYVTALVVSAAAWGYRYALDCRGIEWRKF